MKAFESNPAFQSQNEIDASFTDGACIFLLKMAYYESSSDMAVYLVSLCIGVSLSLLSLMLFIVTKYRLCVVVIVRDGNGKVIRPGLWETMIN